MSSDEDSSWGWRVGSDDENTGENQSQTVASLHKNTVINHDDENEPLLSSQRSTRSSIMGEIDASSSNLVRGKPSHVHQYIVAIAATLGSLAMGTILGYSSPASIDLQYVNETSANESCGGDLSLTLSEIEISGFGSSVNIGALIGAPLSGVMIKTIGRRITMVSILVPFILGWILIGLANTYGMLIAGRIFCGIAAGMVSLSVPTYIGEVASSDIRGLLGTGFQLMVVIGILYSYSLGAVLCWQWLALASLVPAVIFCCWMFFNPESPSFLVMKDRDEDAQKVLHYLRGDNYNIQPELDRLRAAADEDKNNKASFKDLGKPHVLKPLLIALALMFLQQTSGINAILFNLAAIFDSAHSKMSSDASSILIATVQVVMTFVAAILMDKAGRKLLLLISSAVMSVSLVMMGVYFYVEEHDPVAAENLGWLPLLSLIIFISFFSIGYGPVPWCMMGELFTSDVREMAGTLATLTNWGTSFIVTLLFNPMSKALGDYGVYWLFAGICVVNFFFCFFVVEETKGKTIEEITAMFGGPGATTTERRSSSNSSSSSDRRV